MEILISTAFKDFLDKINDKVGGYLWAILAAAFVLLFVILCITIACKNKRIKKLKTQLRETRTELEIERTRSNNEQMFAPVTGHKELFGDTPQAESEDKTDTKNASEDDDTETTEIDEPAEQKGVAADAPKVAYYDKTSVVSPKVSGAASVKFIVKYDRSKDSWVIKKDGIDRVVRRVDTKEEAMTIARALCKKNNASLVVHKKDGKFQRQ